MPRINSEAELTAFLTNQPPPDPDLTTGGVAGNTGLDTIRNITQQQTTTVTVSPPKQPTSSTITNDDQPVNVLITAPPDSLQPAFMDTAQYLAMMARHVPLGLPVDPVQTSQQDPLVLVDSKWQSNSPGTNYKSPQWLSKFPKVILPPAANTWYDATDVKHYDIVDNGAVWNAGTDSWDHGAYPDSLLLNIKPTAFGNFIPTLFRVTYTDATTIFLRANGPNYSFSSNSNWAFPNEVDLTTLPSGMTSISIQRSTGSSLKVQKIEFFLREAPSWHNLVDLRIWGSDGSNQNQLSGGTMIMSGRTGQTYAQSKAEFYSLSDIATLYSLSPRRTHAFVSAVSNIATRARCSFYGKDNIIATVAQPTPILRTAFGWRPSKLRLNWSPAGTGIKIYVSDVNSRYLTSSSVVHTGGSVEIPLTYYNSSTDSVIYRIEVSGAVAGAYFKLDSFEAFGFDPLQYCRLGP